VLLALYPYPWRAADADVLVQSLLREFVLDIGWIIPLLVTATLTVGVVAIRSAFRPLAEVSQKAAPMRIRHRARQQ
jgi:hypothetical protein